jgi:hypothetical protein
MNIDFHYYGTYVAARLAGYDFNSAQTIAHAAQYVDDSDESMLCDSLGKHIITDFTPVPTVQTITDMLKKNFMWSEENSKTMADIWMPFHFLPGNYADNQDIKKYTGPTSDRGIAYSWTFDQESAKQFQLLCQPNSLLGESMINDTIFYHEDKNYILYMTGMRMHTLADTWAHMFYIGIPQWFVNNAGEKVYKIDGQTKKEVEWQRAWPWAEGTDIVNGEGATPNMLAYNSVVYLGHGRMGHLPDYPYLKYQYHAQWSKDDIVKDNQAYFLQAFKQLVKAMQCIKNKTEFSNNSFADLPPETENIIKQILATKVNDQSDTWKANIPKINIGGKPLEVPEIYNKDKWKNELTPTVDLKNTSYYLFNTSARMHVDFVVDTLKAYNIYPIGVAKGNIATTKFKCKKADYIGSFYKQIEYYPKMAKSGITLEIIKATAQPLVSGDIVEIKTTEKDVGEYSFLGAWSTTSLYYYLRNYGGTCQNWMIEKIDTSVTKEIKDGDAVRFKNMYYDKKPYMSTYNYWAGGTYLTTQSDGKSDNAIWIMDGFKQFDIDIITPDYFVSKIIDTQTSTHIHDDMKSYGLIDDKDKADVRLLKITLDSIGLGFLTIQLDEKQQTQVMIQLEQVANS